MKYQEWQKKTNRFVAMTSYTVEKFNELRPYFKEAHDEYLSEYQMNGTRRRGLRGQQPTSLHGRTAGILMATAF
jgi:hypothetical protein